MNKMVLTIAVSALVIAGFFGQICTSQAYAPPVVAKMLNPEQKQALFESTQHARSAAYSEQELLSLGEKTYWRSCENCHGTEPDALPHENRIGFERAVLDGKGEMPSLGFKLSVVEVEAIRQYLSHIAAE